MSHPDVRELQKYLNSNGYLVSQTGPGSLGYETNYFGLKTKASVILFQKANGLTPDGSVGPKTRTLMNGVTPVITPPSNPTPPVIGSSSGCLSTTGFNTLTGLSCGTPSSLTTGCLGTSGYNTITGLPCGTTTPTPVPTPTRAVSGGGSVSRPATQLTIANPTLTLSKVYDGTTSALVTPGALIGVNHADTVSVTAVATYDTKDVGTNKTITVVYTLSGSDVSKYIKPVNYTVTTGEITTKPITVTATPSQTKVYGTSDPVFTYTAPGLVEGDSLTGTLSRATGENVGDYAINQNTLANTNYDITFVSNDFSITEKQLTISNPTITTTKIYNGNTTATVTPGTLSGIVSSDDVTIDTTLATYDTKHVGTDKTITVAYTITGAKASNYIKPINYTTTGIITSIQLTISNPTLTTSKEYDRTTDAVVTPGSLTGVVDGGVTVSATATYDLPNIGTNKTITVVYTLSGANSEDYIKPVNYVVYSGIITQKQLTISSPTLTLTKIYDGNTTASVTPGSLIGVASGEDVTVSAISTYDNSSSGTGKTITTVYTISGASAANYIKPVNGTTSSGVISALQLTISAPTLTTTKTYDAGTTAVVTAGSLIGVINPDTVTVSAVADYDTALPGTGKTITVVYTLGGAQAGNYTKPVNYTTSSGVINAIVINNPTIAGVTAPVTGATPVTTITEGAQFTGTVSWSGSPVTFAVSTVYTATITLTAKAGYTLTGVGTNFFTVAGATATNSANNGVVSAVFPETVWVCGGTLVDSRDSKTYATSLIGSQCWMRSNLNVGTKINGAGNQGTSCASIQKYCYSDNEANCTTYGGLYQWNQSMCGSTTSGATGICPTGWHIPTHDEWTTLERSVCTSGSCVTDFPFDLSTTGWRGTNEGTTLKNASGVFRGLLAGYRTTDGTFFNLGTLTHFWSSVESGGSAWKRLLYSGNATVDRNPYDKAYGFSVRCLKD